MLACGHTCGLCHQPRMFACSSQATLTQAVWFHTHVRPAQFGAAQKTRFHSRVTFSFHSPVTFSTQGNVNFGGDMGLFRNILSGVFILLTTIYGYWLSHRTISAVLKEVSEQPTEEMVGLVSGVVSGNSCMTASGEPVGSSSACQTVASAAIMAAAERDREKMRDLEAAE